MNKKKVALFLLLIVLLGGFIFFDLNQYLTLDFLKSQQSKLDQFYSNFPMIFILSYSFVYIILTALSFPGATVLTLAGGAIFGLTTGTVIVSLTSTIGATLAFLMARFFIRDYVQSKFPQKLKVINEGIEKEGDFYLFTLRLVPIVPFFVINLAMGLTPIKTWRFFLISQIGMLFGTVVYVNAGTQIAQLESLRDVMSVELIFSFALLGVFPLLAKKIISFIKVRKALFRYKAPATYDYNIIVIGAGSGGLVSSYIAAAVKAKVALIEKHKMGGDCLNTGCVPSKALIKSAKIVATQRKAKDYGLDSIDINFSFSHVMERVQRVIKTVEPHDSRERYEGLGVECIEGHATIISPYEVEVDGKILTTKNIIIATGGRPFVPPIPGIEDIEYRTSDNIWEIRKRPNRLLILGGGPIGSELAQAFQRLGSNVTMIEKADHILAREDQDVSEEVMKQFKKEGINILTNHKAVHFASHDGRQVLTAENKGKSVEIEFDLLLIAIGRRSNVEGFGGEKLGIELTERGKIASDAFLRTNFPNIYVCGDVTGDYQFTHVAAHEAWYAAVNALFSPIKSFKVDYRVIPMVTYCDPEVARVGLNEEEAKRNKVSYEVTTYGIDDLDRAIADEEAKGFVKVLTVPGKDTILGVTIVGQHAGDILAEFVLAMKYNLGLNKILGTIHAYPTLAEANKYAAGEWKRAHAPKKVLAWLEKFHAWRRKEKMPTVVNNESITGAIDQNKEDFA